MTKFWEAFINDLSKGRACRPVDADTTKGWLLRVRSSGEFGFVFDDGDKRQNNSLRGISLGNAWVGEDLLVLPKPGRALDMLGLAAHLLGQPVPRVKHCEVVGGIWVFLIQYQPALMACLEEIVGHRLGENQA